MEILELKNNHMTKKETNYKCECPVCGTVFTYTEKDVDASRSVTCPNENCNHVIYLDKKKVIKKTTNNFSAEVTELINLFIRTDVHSCHVYKNLTPDKKTTLIIVMPDSPNRIVLSKFLSDHHFKAVFQSQLDRNTDMDAYTLYSVYFGFNESYITF